MGKLSCDLRALRGGWIYAVLGVWGIVVVALLGWLTAYSYAPGMQDVPPRLADIALPVKFTSDRHRLLMAVHPKCPCSRASLGELARILARYPERLECVVLVYRPAGEPDAWCDTGLVQSARQQPHTEVMVDVDGRYARRLGIRTSGAVILYSPEGTAEYWGGITMARGHAGDNLGSDAIQAVLAGGRPERRTARVFGCAIHADATPPDG